MNEKQIFDKLLEIFKRVIDDDNYDYSKITMESNVFEELAITSIAALYLALEIESEFNVTIQNENTEKLATVGGIVNLILEKMK